MWDGIKANWKQVKGEVKQQWGDMTDDELMEIEGEKDKLVGKVMEKYNRSREEAEQEVDNWAEGM